MQLTAERPDLRLAACEPIELFAEMNKALHCRKAL